MTEQNTPGVIKHSNSLRRADYLYRISLKCLVVNSSGEVLVVKEGGRTWWDLPGGGMDHGESIKQALAREMKEEVGFSGDFTYKVIDAEEPGFLSAQGIWQLRLIFKVIPNNFMFKAGDDGDEIAFKNPQDFKDSAVNVERRIYKYFRLPLS